MALLKDVYNSVFGKDREPMWQQFAKDNNGQLTILRGYKTEYKTEFNYNGFILTIDTYTYSTTMGGTDSDTEYIRGRVDFISIDNLKFTLTPQGVIENIAKLFGYQDINIGDDWFDKKFLIQGNNEFKVRKIFSNESIKKLLPDNKRVRFEITDEKGILGDQPQNGHSMLYYFSEGNIKTIDQLINLYQLLTQVVDSLIKLSSIKTEKSST